MKIEYDPAKNVQNIPERGLSFERVGEFDFGTAYIGAELRGGELRKLAAGYLDRRLHVLCYLVIPDGVRGISFRKANEREAKKYGKPKTLDG